MVPKREWIQPIGNGFRLMRTHIVTFPGSPAMAKDGEVKQSQHIYHHGDTICHPTSGYVTTKLHGTSTCRQLLSLSYQTVVSCNAFVQ